MSNALPAVANAAVGNAAVVTIPLADPREGLRCFTTCGSGKPEEDKYVIPPIGLDAQDEQRRHDAEMEELKRATERREADRRLDERGLPSAVIVSQLRRTRKNSILCNQFLMYVPFLLLFIFYFLVGRPIEPSYWISSQLTGNLLTNQFATKRLSSNWNFAPHEIDAYFTARTVEKINKVDDIHIWLESVVLPAFWAQSTARPVGAIAVGVNLLIGALRLRVLNNEGYSCQLNFDTVSSAGVQDIDTMRPTFDVGAGGCYDLYRSGNSVNKSDMLAQQDTASSGPSFPYAGCSSGDRLYGDLPKSFYSCDGNVFDIPFSSSQSDALTRLQSIRNIANGGAGLVSEKLLSTRLFNLQLFSFTPEAQIYMYTEASVEVSTGGAMITSFRSRPFEVYLGDSVYTASTIYFAFFAAFSLCCLIVFVIDKIDVIRHERFLNILTFWNLLEFSNFAVLFATFAAHIAWTIEGVQKRERIHVAIPDNNPTSFGNQYPVEFERICLLYTIKSSLNAFNIVVIFLLFIKYAARWSSISRAIAAARNDLFGILVIFALIVTSYSLSGVILFGHGMDQFSNMERSLSTTMRILVGDFDYETMKLVNPVLAAVFFWSYNILAIFLMLNFFVGALKNAYGDERKRLEESTLSAGQQESPSMLMGKAVHAMQNFAKDFRSNPKLTLQLFIREQKNRFFEHRDMYVLILAINTIRHELVLAENGGDWPHKDEPHDNLFLDNIDDLVGSPPVTKKAIIEMVIKLYGNDGPEGDRAHAMLNHYWRLWGQVVDDMPVGDVSQTELEEGIAKTVAEALDRMFGNETWPQHRVDARKSWSNVLATSELFVPQEAMTNQAQKCHESLLKLEEALLRNARHVANAKLLQFAELNSASLVLSPVQSMSH